MKPVYSLYRNYFFWLKHNEPSLVQNVLLFSEFHVIKTEASTSCEKLFDKQSPLVKYRKIKNT